MADKYPGFSPYAYCTWNPVKLVDPNGEESVEDRYKNNRTGDVKWHEGHAKQLTAANGDTYTNIGESYSKPIGNGKYNNYFQNCLINQGDKMDAAKIAYTNKNVRTALIRKNSPLPISHKQDLFNDNIARRGVSLPDMVGIQLSGNLFVGGGMSIDVGIGYIKEDGMFGSLSLSPGSGFDMSISAGLCTGQYNGQDAPSKKNYAGLGFNFSAGAGSFYYQYSTSSLKESGWNVSSFGFSAGSAIIIGGTFGVSHTWVW